MKIRPSMPGPRGDARHGFAITDAVVAMLLLTIAVGGLAGSVTFGLKLHRTNRESAIAEQAARAILAELRTETFGEVFATVSASPNREVFGLNPQPDDPDGMVAELIFPTAAGAPGVLREDVVMPALGCPRDLDGDGDMAGAVAAGQYLILPVSLRLRWRGAAGDCLQEYHAVLTQ
jgi:hypothetical protein